MKVSTIFPKAVKSIVVILFWLSVWYIAAAAVNMEIFLPFPHVVLTKLISLMGTAAFWEAVGVSLWRIARGFIYGVVLGFVTALLTHYIPVTEAFIAPLLRTVRATPVVSFILLAFLWLNNDAIPVFIALLMVLPIIWENLSAGLGALDTELSEMAKVYRIPKGRTLTRIIAPQLHPYFFSGAVTSLGLAWKSGIAAEVISYPTVAIGKAMNNAKTTLDTAEVLAWTVVVVVLSLVFEAVIKRLLRKRGKRK